MPRFPKLFAPLVLALAAMGIALGCSGTGGSDTIVPVTGITVRAEALTNGRGCGRGATQIFKYVVVVLGADPATVDAGADTKPAFTVPVAGNLFDCFSDAAFVDLPSSGGVFSYDLEVFAYNEAAFRAAGGDALRGVAQRAGAHDERVVADLRATNPTYTTTCLGDQVGLVQALARCQPLSVGTATSTPAAVQLSTASFPRVEAGAARCDDDYVFVRARFKAGSESFGETTETRCTLPGTGEPATILVSPAIAPAKYTFEVAVLRADRTELGRTTCAADTSPGLTSSALCLPLQ
ncbi:MAG: hypothetical protein KF819_29580 [Labilithrix sp.]|nr:hypothetical protein [Labilithrix sp.]